MNLLHYSEREIETQFQNHLMELVYPPDREKLAKQFKEQRNEGKILQLEYRLVAKDGLTVWVSDHCLITVENGAEVAYCVILDAARHHQAEEELRLSLERHNIIMEQTNDIIFEWDIRNDELYLSPKWKSQYGYQPITKNVSSEIPRISHPSGRCTGISGSDADHENRHPL